MPDTMIDWNARKASWLTALDELYQQLEKWAKDRDWDVLREEKTLTEEHIGSYIAPRLTVRYPGGRLHVDPVGTVIIGAEGRVDLESYPTMNSLLLIRDGGKWQLYTDSRVPWPEEWSREAFFNIVNALQQ